MPSEETIAPSPITFSTRTLQRGVRSRGESAEEGVAILNLFYFTSVEPQIVIMYLKEWG